MKELTLTELRRVARVLGETFEDARVAKVVQPGPTELALLLQGGERCAYARRSRVPSAIMFELGIWRCRRPESGSKRGRAHLENFRSFFAKVQAAAIGYRRAAGRFVEINQS